MVPYERAESLITLSNLLSGCIGAILAGIVTLVATWFTIRYYSKQQSMEIKMRTAGELTMRLHALRDALRAFEKQKPELLLELVSEIMRDLPKDKKEANVRGLLQKLAVQDIPGLFMEVRTLHQNLRTFVNINVAYVKETTYKSVLDISLLNFDNYKVDLEQTNLNLSRYIGILVEKYIVESSVIIVDIDKIIESIKADLGNVISNESKV